MRYSYNIKNLSCANCAKKLEDALNKDEKINRAIVNFSTSKVIIETDISSPFNYVKNIVSAVEPDAILSEKEIKDNKLYSFLILLVGGIIGIIGCTVKLPYHLSMVLIVISYAILFILSYNAIFIRIILPIRNPSLSITISKLV